MLICEKIDAFKSICLMFVIVFCFNLSSVFSQNIIMEKYPELESVVWIEAIKKTKLTGQIKRHSGSGFLWLDDKHVVTCLHLIAGCDSILVYSRASLKERISAAKPIKVLIQSDLVLLELDRPMARTPIKKWIKNGLSGQELVIRGFPLAIERPGPTTVILRDAKLRKLRQIITSQEIESLTNLGFPSLESLVLDIDGAMLPGHSGAALQNEKGELLGICSGGLKQGSVNRAWAIPAENLTKLAASTDVLSNLNYLWDQSESLFSISSEIQLSSENDNSYFEINNDSLNVLILPFAPLENCSLQKIEIEEILKQRLIEHSEEDDLKLNIKIIKVYHFLENMFEVRDIGKKYNADIVLWGDYYEKCDAYLYLNFKYVTINEHGFNNDNFTNYDLNNITSLLISQNELKLQLSNSINLALSIKNYEKCEFSNSIMCLLKIDRSFNDYASVLRLLGLCNEGILNFHEAEKFFNEELINREKLQGYEHLDVLSTMECIVRVLYLQGENHKAFELKDKIDNTKKELYLRYRDELIKTYLNLIEHLLELCNYIKLMQNISNNNFNPIYVNLLFFEEQEYLKMEMSKMIDLIISILNKK